MGEERSIPSFWARPRRLATAAINGHPRNIGFTTRSHLPSHPSDTPTQSICQYTHPPGCRHWMVVRLYHLDRIAQAKTSPGLSKPTYPFIRTTTTTSTPRIICTCVVAAAAANWRAACHTLLAAAAGKHLQPSTGGQPVLVKYECVLLPAI